MDAGIPLRVNVFLQSWLAVIFAVMFVPKSAPPGAGHQTFKPSSILLPSTLVTTTSVTFLPHLAPASYSSGSPGPFRGAHGAGWTISS